MTGVASSIARSNPLFAFPECCYPSPFRGWCHLRFAPRLPISAHSSGTLSSSPPCPAATRQSYRGNMATETARPTTGPRRSLRDEQRQLTRERLVIASYELFAKSGYAATTISDITSAADVNRATFYLHFASKSELFLAAIEHLLSTSAFHHWNTLDAALLAGTRDAIHTWLIDASNWWLDNAAFVLAWSEAISIDENLRANHPALHDRIGQSLTRYKASLADEVERRRRVLLVELLIMQLNNVFTRYWQPDILKSTRTETVDLLTHIWCASLQILPDPASTP